MNDPVPPFILGLVFGSIIACAIVVKVLHENAVEKGYAIYHPTTAMFTWKCDLPSTNNIVLEK